MIEKLTVGAQFLCPGAADSCRIEVKVVPADAGHCPRPIDSKSAGLAESLQAWP